MSKSQAKEGVHSLAAACSTAQAEKVNLDSATYIRLLLWPIQPLPMATGVAQWFVLDLDALSPTARTRCLPFRCKKRPANEKDCSTGLEPWTQPEEPEAHHGSIL